MSAAALPALRHALRVLYAADFDAAARREADAFLQAFTHSEEAWEASRQLLLLGDPGEQARRGALAAAQWSAF